MQKYKEDIIELMLKRIIEKLKNMNKEERIEEINKIKILLHEISPFKNEPVDCVIWVKNERVTSNDYNPNKVAPPEMELLEVSIVNDGYTQPIVSWNNPEKNAIEVVDGFHRNRVGKESLLVKERVHGYLPIVDIRKEQSSKNDRIASTIRHNRARGKHQVDAMSEIVIELKNRNWTNKRISKQLGMDEEEILRLCQISGIENLFSDNDFNKAWVSDDSYTVFEPISDEIDDNELMKYRIPNENDTERIYHTYDKWECAKTNFYKTSHDKYSKEECERIYMEFFKDLDNFEKVANKVISEWKNSCEHYLTNRSMNRIAWIGQASVCYDKGIPAIFCSSFSNLTEEEQKLANNVALKILNKWLLENNRNKVDLNEALSIGRQVELY